MSVPRDDARTHGIFPAVGPGFGTTTGSGVPPGSALGPSAPPRPGSGYPPYPLDWQQPHPGSGYRHSVPGFGPFPGTAATVRVPAPTRAYPALPAAAWLPAPTGRVELAPGFVPAGSVPMAPGFRPRSGHPRTGWTLALIGVAATVLVTALVVAMVVHGRSSDTAAGLVPTSTGDSIATGTPAPTGAPPSDPSGLPAPALPAPTTGSPNTAAPGTGHVPTTAPARPADPGWPPSRVPTSLLPRSSGSPDQREPAGGVVAARARVAGFVEALNDDDPDRANSFLCRSMVGVAG